MMMSRNLRDVGPKNGRREQTTNQQTNCMSAYCRSQTKRFTVSHSSFRACQLQTDLLLTFSSVLPPPQLLLFCGTYPPPLEIIIIIINNNTAACRNLRTQFSGIECVRRTHSTIVDSGIDGKRVACKFAEERILTKIVFAGQTAQRQTRKVRACAMSVHGVNRFPISSSSKKTFFPVLDCFMCSLHSRVATPEVDCHSITVNSMIIAILHVSQPKIRCCGCCCCRSEW